MRRDRLPSPDRRVRRSLRNRYFEERFAAGDKDLLEHPDLHPPGIDARAACKLLGLI
jgi:hypothetical protein